MTLFLGLLKVLHFFGLFMGGGSAFGAAVIGLTAPGVPAEHRATLGAMARRFKIISHTALAVLIVTGFLMATVEGVWSVAGAWFWIKLAGVAALVTGIVVAGRHGKAALSGDAESGRKAEAIGMANMAVLVLILLAAVATFG